MCTRAKMMFDNNSENWVGQVSYVPQVDWKRRREQGYGCWITIFMIAFFKHILNHRVHQSMKWYAYGNTIFSLCFLFIIGFGFVHFYLNINLGHAHNLELKICADLPKKKNAKQFLGANRSRGLCHRIMIETEILLSDSNSWARNSDKWPLIFIYL